MSVRLLQWRPWLLERLRVDTGAASMLGPSSADLEHRTLRVGVALAVVLVALQSAAYFINVSVFDRQIDMINADSDTSAFTGASSVATFRRSRPAGGGKGGRAWFRVGMLAVLRYVRAADGCNHGVDRGSLRRQRGHAPAQQASSSCSSRTTWKVVRPAQPLLGLAAARSRRRERPRPG